jgi:hypothetical protein
MCSDLSARLENIRRLRALWRSGDIKGTLEALSTIDDHGAAVDILSIVWSKSNIFSLDICVSLLPLLKELLGSPHDEYVITAMQVLQIILQSFGPLISQTRLASANQSFVDIQVNLHGLVHTPTDARRPILSYWRMEGNAAHGRQCSASTARFSPCCATTNGFVQMEERIRKCDFCYTSVDHTVLCLLPHSEPAFGAHCFAAAYLARF